MMMKESLTIDCPAYIWQISFMILIDPVTSRDSMTLGEVMNSTHRDTTSGFDEETDPTNLRQCFNHLLHLSRKYAQHIQLAEIVEKYNQTHAIFICGDMNASLQGRDGNDSDKILKRLCEEKGLSSRQTVEATFHNVNNKRSGRAGLYTL